jgi:hypothetical protein
MLDLVPFLLGLHESKDLVKCAKSILRCCSHYNLLATHSVRSPKADNVEGGRLDGVPVSM